MKKVFLIFFVLIFLVGCSSKAKTAMVNSIDKAEEACIGKTSDTQVMNRCSETAQRARENEI